MAQVDELRNKLGNLLAVLNSSAYWDKPRATDECIKAIQALIQQKQLEARLAETKLWYNEWGRGKQQIGDGSWEDFYEYRVAQLSTPPKKEEV